MGTILFIFVVIVVLALVLMALQKTPMEAPLDWILQVLAIVCAIIVILARTGLGGVKI